MDINSNNGIVLVIVLILVLLVFFYCVLCMDSNNSNQEPFINYGGDNVCSKINNQYMPHVTIYNPDDINGTFKFNQNRLLSKNYYAIDEVCPELRLIYENLESIKKETYLIRKTDWEEDMRSRYFMGIDITKNPYIYPFVAFGMVVHDNCQKCLNIWRFLQKIPGLKLATLSMLAPNVKGPLQQGWAYYSNDTIRCYFCLDVAQGSYLSVREKLNDPEYINIDKQNEWTLYDDSRYHYVNNHTDKDRIVLIIDVDRPSTIKKGTSQVCRTTCSENDDLLQIVEYLRTRNRM